METSNTTPETIATWDNGDETVFDPRTIVFLTASLDKTTPETEAEEL